MKVKKHVFQLHCNLYFFFFALTRKQVEQQRFGLFFLSTKAEKTEKNICGIRGWLECFIGNGAPEVCRGYNK